MAAGYRISSGRLQMTVELLNQVSRQTFETIMLVGGPVLLVSLIIGLAISIFQAVTQLQEMTLTFVPKIIAVFLTIMVALPWMVKILMEFTKNIYLNIPLYVN